MIIKRNDRTAILPEVGSDEAVRIAAENLMHDLEAALDVTRADEEDADVTIEIVKDGTLPREGYEIKAKGDRLLISGADRRGMIYGIYTVSEMAGVSPWHFMADVPVLKREKLEIEDDIVIADHPVVEYRGIFINDEEELDKWVRLHMGEPTIGVKTYARIFELLLRLKLNYIWPAMHVNSFNMKRENGELADRMGL